MDLLIKDSENSLRHNIRSGGRRSENALFQLSK